MKTNANVQEYKIGINAIITNFVCIWKSRMFTGHDISSPFVGDITFAFASNQCD